MEIVFTKNEIAEALKVPKGLIIVLEKAGRFPKGNWVGHRRVYDEVEFGQIIRWCSRLKYRMVVARD